MKKRSVHAIYILFVLVLTAAVITPQPAVLANTTTETPNPIPFQDQPDPGQDMLIVLPVEPPAIENIPTFMDRGQARRYAGDLGLSQAQPVIVELRRLKAEGLLEDFEYQADLHGIRITNVQPDAIRQLSNIPTVQAIMPYSEQPPGCAVQSAAANINQVEAFSQLAGHKQQSSQAVQADIQVTNPSIDVEVYDNWSYISGKTNANVTVSMRLIRYGKVVATQDTTSYSDGWYYFYPEWQACPDYGYTWVAQVGDTVEVSAAGNTVSTVVAPLSAWADPVTNIVGGQTTPGRTVSINLYSFGSDPCFGNSYNLTTSANSTGVFSANFSSLIDFNRSAYAGVRALDANGNGTVIYPHAYNIVVDFQSGDVYGSIKPDSSYTLTLRRGGSPIGEFSSTSSATGDYYGWFMEELQAGDIIEVSGGGVTMQYTIAPLTNLVIDPNTDQISGVTTAGRRVQTAFQKSYSYSYYSYFPTSCSYGYSCGFQVAGGGGNFTINSTSMDLMRGDRIYLSIYDNDGNSQQHNLMAPAIFANINTHQIAGVWSTSQGPDLTIIHRNSGGTVKNTYTDIWKNWWSNSFSVSLINNIEPGDRFDVSDGTTTETMTVPATLPVARLNSSNGRLTGNLPAGSTNLLAVLYDERQVEDTSYSFCVEQSTGGGLFDLSFSGAQVNGGDTTNINIRNADGHYIQLYRNAFNVYTWISYYSVSGYTETPNTNVTARLRRGGSLIDTVETASNNAGYWNSGFNSSVQVGDRIEVSTADGNSVNLDIPQLNLNMDAAANRIFGKLPANSPAIVQLNRHYNYGYSRIRQVTTGDAGNNYSVNFNNKYFYSWFYGRCEAATVGHHCAGSALYYYTAAGHGIYVWGGYPSPAAADSFENDNSMANATPYTVLQTHTFHTEGDEDWVSFTVPAGDVGTNHYKILTLNQGWGTETYLKLYRSDGSLIMEGYGWNNWLPDAAGTYYVRITPLDRYSAAHCDAIYDLMILPVRAQVFLPLVKR